MLAAGASAQDQREKAAEQDPRHANIMPLDQVKVGMRGYGRTVFQGTDIEPFAIEVMSVVSGTSPNRSTIWVVSDDPRLALSGPVQGMSGSPMYLWEEGQAGVVGLGGRLIGAFAFGYTDVNVCLVGVQPIEYMRDVGRRTQSEDLDDRSARGGPGSGGSSGGGGRGAGRHAGAVAGHGRRGRGRCVGAAGAGRG